ncbi:putative Smr domain-containing protein [Quillaja saponaria]|uniref:Smr domain-containing protein n=1 Tax=Quillaja saponaria TaxID=32244 RepID=A0AAD7PQI3_QUISA|nr:putative Smr domain-containing protein [Quillaja saponaria]
MKNTKKKKRARGSKPTRKDVAEEEEKREILETLVEAFSLSSIEKAALAYKEAKGDPDKAAEILRRSWIDNVEDPSTCSTSTSSGVLGMEFASSSGSSEGYLESNCVQNMMDRKGVRGGKQKKVVAATGTVSTVLGKEYVRRDTIKRKGISNCVLDREEAEQFLCSMLGDGCELSMALVRDVLCQCRYDVEKALDILLDLSASSPEQFRNDRHIDDAVENVDDMRFLVEHSENLVDRASECTSHSSEGELQDNIWSTGYFSRNYAKVLASSEAQSPSSPGSTKSNLSQKVLESLFNINRSTEYDKKTMNWRNIVTKFQSLGPQFDVCPTAAEPQQHTYAKGEEYHVLRKDAKRHWDSMRSYYHKAATSYTKGDRQYASYLSEQGKVQTKLAQKAEERASHDIFKARNKGIENVITIDLHGQHVKQGIRMLKLHLLFGTYVPSIQVLRVITGCGSHGVGRSKLKQSVIKLLEKEGIEWSEENRGTVLIKLTGYREFSFLDSDSGSDSN